MDGDPRLVRSQCFASICFWRLHFACYPPAPSFLLILFCCHEQETISVSLEPIDLDDRAAYRRIETSAAGFPNRDTMQADIAAYLREIGSPADIPADDKGKLLFDHRLPCRRPRPNRAGRSLRFRSSLDRLSARILSCGDGMYAPEGIRGNKCLILARLTISSGSRERRKAGVRRPSRISWLKSMGRY